ncbi:MAG: hypothetical protein N2204_04680, partial [Anaerolineae bacterium]|nr:hypothetical protein [Anaerolineae bacterium]
MISFPAKRRGLLFAAVVALLWLSALLAFRYNPGRSAWDRVPLIRPDFAGVAGINLEGSELEPQRLQELFRALPGIRWVRFTLPWDEIEPLPGQFRWDRWDTVFNAFAARSEIVPVVVPVSYTHLTLPTS